MSLYSGLGGGVGPSAHTDVLSASPDSPSSRRALVEEIKRRGRACVASKNYPDADALYGKGIDVLSSAPNECDPSGGGGGSDAAVLRSNRSLVRLQMGRVAEALEDADAAVAEDPSYVKAHWRRGQACVACGDARGALESFRRALELEPTNKALKREMKTATERVKKEEEAMNEAKENGGDNGANDVVMEDAMGTEKRKKKKDATNSSKKSHVAAALSSSGEQQKKASGKNVVKESGDGAFTKSDHVRGYKIRSDGKKTSYFDREISEETKKLIGDIAPKKLDANGSGGDNGSTLKPIAAPEGASAWNKAGTWEERDVTPWAKETLTAGLLAAEYVLPPGSPSPGARAAVTKVSKLEGHASYATARGKKRHMHEFSLTVEWTFTLGEDHSRTCHGEMTLPDVDGTVELGEGYDIVGYRVDGGSAPGTGPLLERFVRDGGLRDSVRDAVDDWVRLFRAAY